MATPATNNDTYDNNHHNEPFTHDLTEPLLNGNGNNNNNNNNNSNNKSYSLAYAPTTKLWRRIIVSVWALSAHVMFYYGQTSPMFRPHASLDVDIWVNATSTISRKTFGALGLNHSNHLTHTGMKDFDTYSYGFAIKKLWIAKDLGNPTLPRLSAIFLIIASGIWPHLKLLLLHMNWFLPISEKTRTQRLYWLGTFGKWSLADVFVVCVLIAIIHINWNLDPPSIQKGIMNNLRSVVAIAKEIYPTATKACTKITKLPCDKGFHFKCWECETVVSAAYMRPDWAQGIGKEILQGVKASGGGSVETAVDGYFGIYCFCAGVLLSLFLSLYVDTLDHWAKSWMSHERQQRRQEDGQQEEQSLVVYETASSTVLDSSQSHNPNDDDDNEHGDSSVSVITSSTRDNHNIDTTTNATTVSMGHRHQEGCRLLKQRAPDTSICIYILAALGACGTCALVFLGTIDLTMQRQVHGAIPNLVKDVLGLDWTSTVSLLSLGQMTGAAGGWDTFLMGTFLVFLVFGPMVRGILCVLFLILPLPRCSQLWLLQAVDFVGAFCAWDVFFVMVYLVQLQVPTITNTMYTNKECKYYSDDGSCFNVTFELLKTSYCYMIPGGILLLVFSVFAVKTGYYALDPYDDGDPGGPYCSCCCCWNASDDDDDSEEEEPVHLSNYELGEQEQQQQQQQLTQKEEQELVYHMRPLEEGHQAGGGEVVTMEV